MDESLFGRKCQTLEQAMEMADHHILGLTFSLTTYKVLL